MSEVYYRIYSSDRLDYKLTVVCMQDFDEDDYYQDRFFTDDNGNKLRFDDEEDAKEWLNKKIKPEKIDPEYLQVKFHRSDYLL